MRFIEVPALITEDIEDPNIVDITETETVTASINGTTLTIDGDSKVSGEVTITLTGDVTVNAVTVSNIKQPSIHKIIIKTNGTGNFTYVPNGDVTASSVSTTTKTGSDLDILLITTSGGDTYLDLDVADYVSPAANFSNVLTGFNVSDLTSAYGTTAKLYKPDGTLLTTVNSPATGSGVNFGYTESSPGDVIYKLEVTDDLGRKSKYNLPRKWINYAMETTSTPGFEKLALEGNEYTSTVTLPNLTSSSKARIHKTTDHGYMGIKFKIQGRNSTDDAWTDIANADEDDEVLAFGNYTYQRIWVKPTAKATTTVSSSNVVTLSLTDFTEENVTTSFTGMDPFEIDETSNVFVFEEPAKIGTVPFTVTLGTETYTNAVTATTEEVSTVPNTDFSTSNAIFTYGTSGGNQAAMIFGSDDANYLCVYNPADGEQMFVYKGDPSTGSYALYGGTNGDGIYRHADYVADATPLEGSAMSWDGKYMLLKKYYRGDLTIFKNNESTSTYDQLIANHTATEATTASWGASAFIPNSYDFVMTRHAYNDYGFRVVYFENSGDTWTEKWTWENPNSGGLTHSNSDTKWGRFGFQFSKDKKYAALTSYANPTSVAVLKVDLENTTTQNKFEKIWEEGITQGYACAMSPDGKYIIAGNQKIFKNNDAGDWTTKTEVQSEFTNNTIFTDYCIFLGDKYVAGGNTSSKHLFEFYPKKEVTLAFANPTLTLTGQNVTISSAKLYKDDVLFHTYGTESNVVLRSDQTGTYQAIVNDVYYSNRITPDFTTTRSVSAPQLEFDGYNKLHLSNITPTSTTLGLPDGTTRDLTTQSNVYIYKSGTYTANVQTSDTFAYLSNVVNEVSTPVISPFTSTQNDINITGGTENPARYYKFDTLNSNSSKLFYENYTISNDVHNINKGISFYYDANDNLVVNHNDTNGSGDPGAIENVTTSSGFLNSGVINASPGDIIRGRPGDNTSTLRVQYTVPTFNQGTPSLTFDGFNKLSIENITQTSSTITYPNGSTVNTNAVSDVYVKDIGEYVLEASDANTFVTSNVEVGALDTIPGFTAAFHHGAFSASDYSSAYSSVAAAATAGHVYSDTPAGTYTWGTLAHVKERENPDFTANSTLHTDYSSTYGWTTNSGWVVSADSEQNSNQTAWKAFDKLDSTFWSSNHSSGVTSSTPATLTIQYPTSQVIKSYTITSKAKILATRFPSVWKLQGYDGSSWVDVGSEQTVTTWPPGTMKRFDVSTNITAYTKYQLQITTTIKSATDSTSGYVAIAGWKLYTLNSENDTGHNDYTKYTWEPLTSLTGVDVLTVAGGAGGGSWYSGGGGGAGGLILNENVSLSSDQKTIQVGNGGDGAINNPLVTPAEDNVPGRDGYDTYVSGLTVSKGGGGGASYDVNGNPGGSGGGGGYNTIGGSGTTNQGYKGGDSSTDNWGGGGGGGSGGAGADESSSGGNANGGIGTNLSSKFGTTYGDSGWFASGGGGGGRTNSPTYNGGSASQGGGTNGVQSGTASDAQKYTGGGGGGAGWNNSSSFGGSGGSGIVIIKKLGAANPPALNFDGYNKLSIDNNGNSDTGMKNVTISGGPWNNHTFKPDDNAQKGKFQWDLWSQPTGGSQYVSGDGHSLEYVVGYGWYILNQDGTGFGDVSPTSATTGTYVDVNGVTQNFTTNLASSSGGVLTIAHSGGTMTVNETDFFEGGVIPPKVGSLESVTIKKDGAPFATTTSNTVYIRDTGTYTAEVKGSGAYVTEVSKVVSGSVTTNQEWKANEDQILYASDAATNHYFGSDTAISGNYAIVGAFDEDVSGGTDSGAAYIFYKSGTTWSQQAKLKASDPSTSDKFGHRVDIEGDYAIVGAYNKNSSTGAVYIFYRSGTSWTQQAKLTASNAGSGDEFGRAVGISGDYAFVGARREDTGGTDRGSVYIYVRSGTTWSQHAQIQASDAQDSDNFGWALSVDGDYAIVGAYLEDTGGSNAGSAYIFYKSGTTWSQQAQIQASDRQAEDRFGVAVSISGDYIVVGASGEDAGGADAGSAYVFVRSGTTWSQQAILRASDAQASDNYAGYDPAVSISGNRVVVGAFGEDAGGSNAGAAYIFERSGTVWTEVKKITASDAQASDLFGQTVAIDGTTVLVGAREEDTKATAAGAAYVYEKGPVGPNITYDNYNKITLNQLNYEDTATVTDPNGSTHDIGTAKTMYVKDIGDYVFKISGTDKYVESNVHVSSVDLAGAPTKPIDFDGYNKLTLISPGENAVSNVTYFSNTYELGSANVFYINGAGTYNLEMSGSNVFALSNTFVGTISSLPDTLLHLDFESGGLVSTGLNTTQYKYGSSSLYRNNSSVTVSNDGSYNIGNTSSAKATIMLWVRPESYPDYNGNANRIIVAADGRSESSASYKKWAIVLREHSSIDEVWQFHYPNSSNTNLKVSYTPTDVPVGAWYHVCVTIESGSLKFYIDGVEVTSSLTGSKSDIESAWAGFNDDEGFKFCKTDANYLKGWVDDFKLFNSVLTLSEITAHMNASKLSSPSLTFDNYNKLTLENFTTVSDKQWPPSDGTLSSFTVTNSDKDAEWTISGASYGNGMYKAKYDKTIHASHHPGQVFDRIENSTSGEFHSASGADRLGNLSIEYPESFVVDSYEFRDMDNSESGSGTYAPKDFTMEASSDGSTWTVLDTRSGINTWATVPTQKFTVTGNSTAYKHYRISVSDTNGGNYLEIMEMRFYERNTRTTKLTDPNGSTYALGQTQDTIYIKDQGDYFLEVTNSDQSAVVAKTVGTISTPTESAIPSTVTVTIRSSSHTGTILKNYTIGPTTTSEGTNQHWTSASYYEVLYDTSTTPNKVKDKLSTTYTDRVTSWEWGTTKYQYEIFSNSYFYITLEWTLPVRSPKLTFDNYNKLTLENVDSDATSNIYFFSNTYEMGSRKELIINDTGTYHANIYSSNTLALVKKQVTGTVGPETTLSETSIAKQFIYDENGYTDAMFSEGSETQSIRLSSDGLAMALGDGNYNSNDGRLYYYERSSISDTFTKTHTFDAVSSGLEFGASVDMNAAKTRIAISGSDADNSAANAGRVYIYDRASTSASWPSSPTATITPPASTIKRFGHTVNMSDDGLTMITSGDGIDSTANRSGVYVYEYAVTAPSASTITFTSGAFTNNNSYYEKGPTTATTVLYQRRTALYGLAEGYGLLLEYQSDGTTKAYCNSPSTENLTPDQLSIDGGPFSDSVILISGKVLEGQYYSGVTAFKFTVNSTHLFSQGPEWSKTFQVTQGISRFGFKVAMNKTGTRFIAGGTNTAYYVYHKESGTWSSTVQLTGATGYHCGMSPDGNTVAVGIVQYSSNLGRVAVYKYSGSSWGSVVNIDTTVGTGTYQIGNTPVFNNDGTLLVTGCSAYNSYMGCFEMWKYESGSWVFKKQFLNPTVKTGHGTDTGEFFGGYLSMDYAGTSVIVSNPGNDVVGADYGRVVLYGAVSPPSLTYDTSNKLSIENFTPTSTTLTDPNGSSFDIGTASNVYIRDSGKYSIASKDANTFVLTSNTVTETPSGTTYTYTTGTTYTITTDSLFFNYEAWNYSGSGNWLNQVNTANNPGVMPSSITYNSTSPKSFVFNNSNSERINIGDVNLQQNWTLECWAKFSDISTSIGLFGHGIGSTNSGLHINVRDQGTKTRVGFYQNDVDATFSFQADTWYHMVYTYNNSGTSRQIYINGVLQTLETAGTSYGSNYGRGTDEFSIGNTYSPGTTGDPMKGEIAVARMYTKVLSATEIGVNYTAGYLGSTLIQNTGNTPSQVYDNTKTITVKDIPTDVVGKIYKGSTAYTIHATTSSSNVIIKNTGTYVSVFTTATQAFLTNAVNVNATPTTTSDDTTIEDAAPIVTVTTTTVGEPLSYKAYLKTGINVNASTSWTAYDIFGSGYSEEINQGSFTLANSNLVAPETGYYRLSFNIYIVSVSGSGERTHVGVKPTVEGTDLNEISASNYIRVTNGHNEASTSMSTIIHLTGNKEVNLKFARLSTVGRNNQINPGSLITLEKVTTSTLYKAYLKTGINVNASTSWTAYDIFGSGYSEEINQGSFTLANSNLVAPETGYYRLSFNIYLYSTGDRTNVGVKPVVEGTDLNEISASDYIRNYEGHNEASTNMSTIVYLSGNKEVNLKFARLTDTTNSVTIQSGSFITLEKI